VRRGGGGGNPPNPPGYAPIIKNGKNRPKHSIFLPEKLKNLSSSIQVP